MTDMTRLTVDLERDKYNRLKAICAENGASLADFVRSVVDDLVSEHDFIRNNPTKKIRGKSLINTYIKNVQ